ncbi:unnamed protein product [Ranitomeya imitator]|uniref:Ig-like domain-containing protein n=1 Tax=Ranitomeya imitator TaxID=111125 RepID=A0ABN9MH23_9NEOB|nr:unnamed protein product [Ranitomeya imitator]
MTANQISCHVPERMRAQGRSPHQRERDHTAMDNKRPTILILASCKNWTQATLFCLVSNYWPHHISVTWFKNGKLLTDSGKDFAAMLNKKDNTYFGKSEISVNWNETDTYTCKATHQGQDSLQDVTKCSACKNIIEEPVVELKLPSNEDLQNGNAKIKCLIRVSNLDNSQVSLKLNNDMKIPQITPAKNVYTATYMISRKELKEIKTVTCAVNRACSPMPVEISKGVAYSPVVFIRDGRILALSWLKTVYPPDMDYCVGHNYGQVSILGLRRIP